MICWYHKGKYLENIKLDDIRKGKKVIIWSEDHPSVKKRVARLYEELGKEDVECIFCADDGCDTQYEGIRVVKPQPGKNAVIVSALYNWKDIEDQAARMGYPEVFFFLEEERFELTERYLNTFMPIAEKNTIHKKAYKYVHLIPDEKFFFVISEIIESGFKIEEHFFVIYNMCAFPACSHYGTWDKYQKLMEEKGNIYLLHNVRPLYLDNWDENVENLDFLLKNARKIIFHSEFSFRPRENAYWKTKLDLIRDKGVFIPWAAAMPHSKKTSQYIQDILQNVKIFAGSQMFREEYCSCYPKLNSAVWLEGLFDMQPIKKLQKRRTEHARNILVAHSAWPVTKAVETLEYLSKIDSIDNTFHIYCITSYGSEAEKIETIGRERFGDRFTAVSNYMEYNEYVDFLSMIDVAVFGMEDWAGPIAICLLFLLGAKVYMKPDTQAWKRKVQLGYRLGNYYSVQDETVEELMDNPHEEYNRAIAENLYTMEGLVRRWRKLYEYE